MTFCSWSFFCLHMRSLASFKKSPLRSVLVALAGTKTLFLHPPPPGFPEDDDEDQAAHADGGLGALQAAAVHRRAGVHGWEGVVGAKLLPQSEGLQSPRCTIFLADLFVDWFSFLLPRLCTPPGTSAFME